MRFAAPILLLLALGAACAPEPANHQAATGANDRNSSGSPTISDRSEQPNILVFIADDLGMADLSYLGGQPQTPVIDQLAADGIRLSNFHAFPVCSPSRAALFTGRSPLRYGLAWSPLPPWSERGFPESEITLAEALSGVGYQTALIGKWHLGHSAAEHHPHQHGFDYFYGCLNGSVDYWHRKPRRGGMDWQRNGEAVAEDGYTTHLIADDAIRLIEKHDFAQPLFLTVSFTAPHQPLQAPESAIEAYASIEDSDRRTYCAMVSEMDRAVGQIQTALKARGQDQRSVILFLGDNGGARDSGADNQPYRGGKSSVFEGGIKTPAVLHAPSRWAPQELTTFTSVLDLAPTLAQLANAQLHSTIDGVSLLPALQSPESGLPSKPTDDLNLDRGSTVFVAVNDTRAQLALFADGFKYIRRVSHADGEIKEWLYHIAEDPTEKKNLLKEQSDRIAAMRTQLAEWLSLDDSGATLNQIPPAKEEEPANWQAPEDWTRQ